MKIFTDTELALDIIERAREEAVVLKAREREEKEARDPGRPEPPTAWITEVGDV